MADTHARYAWQEDTCIIELGGDIRHPLGPALNATLDQVFDNPDISRFRVDLSSADTIDSTCLGILARIANQAQERGTARPVIVSTNEDITATLLAICFDQLFELWGEPPERSHVAWHEILQQDPGAGQLSDTVLDAHRRLSGISDSNAETFRGVVEALERAERGDGNRGEY